MNEGRFRHYFDGILGKAEVTVYSILAVLLAVTALVTIAGAGKILWNGITHSSISTGTLGVLNELLVVLMLVEILHTVRISIRSHLLVITEPFLVVGLIACIRRVLVVTLEAATLTKAGAWANESSMSVFRGSLMELGLLGFLILVLVYCITLLRRHPLNPKDLADA
ncbi:MAG TPA: phosphate-starvation-inducible PsiE family protein [Candidatus Sulfotelmatobacter sp.]|nr:phosphate-starvation-inducible PsiE family protein [Candidatus Sulfotelmatobacter sp.]